ncbi:MAG: MerR family transcriptional regulator [Microbacteriaceae bacterium]
MAQVAAVSNLRAIKLLTIGQVLNLLNPEFPELSPSKLRFLEEQDLVTPSRTPSGYRKYTEQDVQRVRIVLELQRDKYLPLKVIRQYLADIDAGKVPTLPGSNTPVVDHLKQSKGRKYTELDLIAETAITPQLIADAQAVSLIGAEPFEAADLEIARAIMHLQRFGIQPRHLRGIKAAADREIGIIEGVVAPVLAKKDTSSRSRAAHYAMEISNQFAAIQAELVRSVIAKMDK